VHPYGWAIGRVHGLRHEGSHRCLFLGSQSFPCLTRLGSEELMIDRPLGSPDRHTGDQGVDLPGPRRRSISPRRATLRRGRRRGARLCLKARRRTERSTTPPPNSVFTAATIAFVAELAISLDPTHRKFSSKLLMSCARAEWENHRSLTSNIWARIYTTRKMTRAISSC